jgi:membrane protease YdiL (CAAX protease family)
MIFALPFLVVVGLALPLLSLSSYRRSLSVDPASEAGLPIRAIAIQIFVVQAVVLSLALLASFGADLALAWSSAFTLTAWLSAIMVSAGAVFVAWLEARTPLGPRDSLRRKLRQVAASNPIWIALTVVAGGVEEYAYRGVLTAILAGSLGFGAATVVSAGLFGLAHFGAGWRAAVFGVGFALAMQALVQLSGGLLLAVLAHAVYDLTAAWLGHRLANRLPERTSA